jgi:hypothetical protein
MKKIYIIFMLLFPLFLCFCSGSKVTENYLGNGLKFYLLKDSTITAKEIMGVNLSDLNLAEKPFLSNEDLIYYDWSKHSFEIGLSKANEIKSFCDKNISMRGIPFVVTVDKERIYLGAFWTSSSSYGPTLPHIDALFMISETSNILILKKAWDSYSINPDLRNDERIYNSLIKYRLLLK